MERALTKQRAGIVQKQVAAGREFKVGKHACSYGSVHNLVFSFLLNAHLLHTCFASFQGCAFYSKPEVIVFKVRITQRQNRFHL